MKPPRHARRARLALILACVAFALPASAQSGAHAKLTPRLLATIANYEGPSGFLGRPALVAFSPDGRTAATRDSQDKTVRLWDLATGKELRALTGRKRDIETKWKAGDFPSDAFIPVPFGPEGRAVLVEHEDDLVTVFETETGREVSVLDHKTESNTAKALLKMALGSPFGIRQHWLHMSPVFSPDGRLVATANGDKFPKLWDASTGRLKASLKAKKIDFAYLSGIDVYYTPSFAFSPDSRTLVTYRDRSTQVWDAEAGALRQTLKKSSCDGVAFSPDSRLLATCGGASSAKLWDVETGKLVREFAKSEKETHYVAFSPDGRLLLTASDAGVRLWDVDSGEQAAALAGSRFPASFSPDGRRLATGGNAKTAYVYEISSK